MTFNNSISSPAECFTSYDSARSKSGLASINDATSSTTANSRIYTPTTPDPDNSSNVFRPSVRYSKLKKVYPCSQCTKQFNRPSALETHSYTHSLEKPFQCLSPNCGRKFSVVSNWRRHFKIHQKQAVGSNRIKSQERLQGVRKLVQKNPIDERTAKENEPPSLDLLASDCSTFLSGAYNQTPFLPLLSIANNQHTKEDVRTVYQDITRIQQVQPPLYYEIPYHWSEQSNVIDNFGEVKIKIHENQLVGSENAVPSSILSTCDFNFLY